MELGNSQALAEFALGFYYLKMRSVYTQRQPEKCRDLLEVPWRDEEGTFDRAVSEGGGE